MLAKLQKEQPVENTEIITLAFHVDYWNYLGWRDEFSSAEFSQRQNDYSNALNMRANYTPQMIVDGMAEFVGSKQSVAKSEIAEASENQKPRVELAFDEMNSELKIKINEISVSEDSEVLLAVAEDDLETNVKAGENSGRTLKHFGVVRKLQKIAKIGAKDSKFDQNTKIEFLPDWKKENLRLVVFAQAKKSKKIFAVGQLKF